jgi:polyisoprenoid-binding protein YceI
MSWKIDPTHSQIEFSVRHMMISNVRGRFEKFSGTVEFDEANPANLTVDITIDAASINTHEAQRDAHLASADFFNVEQYPSLTFKSTSVQQIDAQTLKVAGDLTIAGVTRPVTLDVEYAGTALSPWGTTSAGFSAHTRISRKDFGLTWNAALETGGFVVGDEVKIGIELEAVREQTTERVAA